VFQPTIKGILISGEDLFKKNWEYDIFIN